jgi:hypothetical protein
MEKHRLLTGAHPQITGARTQMTAGPAAKKAASLLKGFQNNRSQGKAEGNGDYDGEQQNPHWQNLLLGAGLRAGSLGRQRATMILVPGFLAPNGAFW